jgi:tetratricopeptide (TPR) repeat protein
MSDEATLAAFRRGDNAEAERLAERDLERAADSGDTAGQVNALCMLARTALRAGRLDDVEAKAVAAHELAGDEPRLARMPVHLRAVAARMAGRDDDARALYRRSIALNDALDEGPMAAAEHRNLAYVEIHAGNHDEARRLFAESRRRLEGVAAPTLIPYLTFDEATVALLDGDLLTARARLDEAEAQFAQQGVVPDPDDAAEISRVRQLTLNCEPPR